MADLRRRWRSLNCQATRVDVNGQLTLPEEGESYKEHVRRPSLAEQLASAVTLLEEAAMRVKNDVLPHTNDGVFGNWTETGGAVCVVARGGWGCAGCRRQAEPGE